MTFVLVAPEVGRCGSPSNSGDQIQAYERRMSGDVRPLEVVMRQSQSLGTVLDARLIGNSYRLKILSSSGHVRTVFVDATGGTSQSHRNAGGGQAGVNAGAGGDSSDGSSGKSSSDSGPDNSGSDSGGSKRGSDSVGGRGGKGGAGD